MNQIVGTGSNEATHIQTPIIQQNLNLGNVVPTQVILTNNGSASASTQQPTQYVVQNVGTPVSFVQSKFRHLTIDYWLIINLEYVTEIYSTRVSNIYSFL